MTNQIITNEMHSVLDLSGIKDIHGNTVTLRPRGGPGSSREVPESALAHEVVQRVLDCKWISVKATGTAVTEPPAPTNEPDAAEMAAAVAEVARVAAEAEAAELAAAALVVAEEAAEIEAEEAPEPPTAPPGRATHR